MPRKPQMNANYRKNERLLEDGQIDVPVEGSEYTAGSGISITNKVISNTAQPDVTKSYVDTQLAGKVDTNLNNVNVGQATAGQVLAVNSSANGVEWQSIVSSGGFEYYAAMYKTSGNISSNAASAIILSLEELPLGYEYILFLTYNGYFYIPTMSRTLTTSDYNIFITNKTNETRSYSGYVFAYRKSLDTPASRFITIIGNTGEECLMIPSGGTSGQVFKKTGSNYGQGSWSNINEVPSSTSSDSGKVLTVNSSGTAEWATASGGSGKTAVSSISDLNVGDVFIGNIVTSSNVIFGVSAWISTAISGTYVFEGSIVDGTTSQYNLTINSSDIIDVTGFKI